MQRILLVSKNTRHQSLLEKAIDRQNCSIVVVIESITNLATELQKCAIDIVVIDLDNTGEAELEPIRQIMQNNPLPIVMFVRQGDRKSAANATIAGVSAYVVDGLQVDRIAPILTASVTRFQEIQSLREELALAKTSLQERKTIERAKGLLMEQRDCNENDAYKALRQLAMERNKRLAEVAQSVIDSMALLKI